MLGARGAIVRGIVRLLGHIEMSGTEMSPTLEATSTPNTRDVQITDKLPTMAPPGIVPTITEHHQHMRTKRQLTGVWLIKEDLTKVAVVRAGIIAEISDAVTLTGRKRS
jgi:hypothetical protein